MLFAPFWALIAMVLAQTTRRFVVVPGVGELGTALGSWHWVFWFCRP